MAILNGDFGNDRLVGVDGETNEIYGDAPFPVLYPPGSTGGDDTLIGGANSPNNSLYGDAWDLGPLGTGGNDTLIGGADSTYNFLYGDAFYMDDVDQTGGDDTLIGGANSTNYLYGDARVMGPLATSGNDILIGGEGGTNYLIGDDGQGSGPTFGDDRLVSAAFTTDLMWGDSEFSTLIHGGHDTFVFGPDNGNDIIYDFRHLEDIIEIHAKPIPTNALEHIPAEHIPTPSHTVGSFTDLDIDVVGSDSVIHFDAHNSVTVMGVTNLTADDFLFVI
jgi:hypothetical protein